jgi:hypothetical protein
VIISKLGEGSYAAKACTDYSETVNGNVYDDWFRPSMDGTELDVPEPARSRNWRIIIH